MGDHEPRDRSKQHGRATAGPSADDRFGPGLVGTNMQSRILAVAVDNDRTRVTMSRGKYHGVHVGMEGYIKAAGGMLSELQIDTVEERRCQAFVDVTPDELKNHLYATLNPTSMPKRVINKEFSARIIGVSVEGGRTKIIIAQGSTHGVTAGMRGHLAGPDGREGAELTIEGTTARQSFAFVAGTVDHVHQHPTAVLHPTRSRPAAPIQRRANGHSSSTDVQATAQAGVAGADSRLPHFDTIQRAFGAHDISGVRAQVGGAATPAATSLGAQAYATGDKVAFASAPDLHTAAHEAAHAIQQRNGVVGFQGLGAADDEHERHADAVADAVVAGQSVESLLDQLGGGKNPDATAHAIQRKPTAGSAIVGKGDKQHAITPDDLVRSPNQVKIPTPGKAIRDDGLTGKPAYDTEPLCQREPGLDGCGFLDRPRDELIDGLRRNIMRASTNQKDACLTLKAEILAKKEDDLGLMPQLLMSAIGLYLGSVVTPLALALRTRIAGDAIADEAVKHVVKTTTGFYSKKVENKAKKAGADTDKQAKLDLITYVRDRIDAASVALEESALNMTDAELLVFDEAMNHEFHKPRMYEDAMRTMLEDFATSGVTRIGRGLGDVKGTAGGRDGARRFEDRRCVWVMVNGAPELFFQTVDARHARRDSPQSFGGAAWDRDEKPVIEAPVPKDFWVVAVQKHWDKWGTPVPVLLAQQDVAAASALLAAQQVADDAISAAPEPR